MPVKESKSPLIVIIFLGILAALIVLRLLFLVLIKGSEYSNNALQTRTITIENTAKRGTIYDRNGIVLAASVDATTIYCNPTEVENVEETSKLLQNVLGGEESDYREALNKKNTTFAYIKRQANVSEANKLKEEIKGKDSAIKGIYFLEDSKREYPNGQVAGQLIGICDVDGNGICGLEMQYDDILRGTNGQYIAERSISGATIPGSVKENKRAVEGQDIMVSIDISLQSQVEDKVAKQATSSGCKQGSALVMDSETGEIYAMCSYPYLNPADTKNSETGSDNVLPITTSFEPGSMMKTLTALGILEAGAMQPTDSIYCPAVIQADEYKIEDAYERSDTTMTLDQILTNSSNVGISLASDKIGRDKVYYNILKSKILDKTGIDFPGEAAGYVDDVTKWSQIAAYNITFGQGITTTPLQLARFYAAIANNGVAVTPHFLISKPRDSETVSYSTFNLGYSQESLEKITSMLHNVVANNSKNHAKVEGYDVCGKTSTAEYSKDGEYVKDRYNNGFCGFLNNASLKLTCYTGMMNTYKDNVTTQLFGDIMKIATETYQIVPNKTN